MVATFLSSRTAIANLLQQAFVVIQLFDVLRDRKVVAGLETRKVRGDNLLHRRTAAPQDLARLRSPKTRIDSSAMISFCCGSEPFCGYSASSRLVLSFDSCTLGWSKGSTPSSAPAIAVANSHRKIPRPDREDRAAYGAEQGAQPPQALPA